MKYPYPCVVCNSDIIVFSEDLARPKDVLICNKCDSLMELSNDYKLEIVTKKHVDRWPPEFQAEVGEKILKTILKKTFIEHLSKLAIEPTEAHNYGRNKSS